MVTFNRMNLVLGRVAGRWVPEPRSLTRSRARRPGGAGLVPRGRKDFTLYCTTALMNESLPIQWSGHPAVTRTSGRDVWGLPRGLLERSLHLVTGTKDPPEKPCPRRTPSWESIRGGQARGRAQVAPSSATRPDLRSPALERPPHRSSWNERRPSRPGAGRPHPIGPAGPRDLRREIGRCPKGNAENEN